jgi:RsiW-degrading membrane proteinase PrsW (M82 family)
MEARPSGHGFCPACGTAVAAASARFCASCGATLSAGRGSGNPGSRGPGPATPASAGRAFQHIADRITDNLGLERIEGFSPAQLFSEALKHRTPDEIERYLTVGAPATTPVLTEDMGQWPRPWMFLRTLAFTLLIYLPFYFGWKEYGNPNVLPGLIMVGSFAVPLAMVMLFFELNTPRNVSFVRVVQLVMLGGATSILISLVLFDATRLSAALGAPAAGIVEEAGKLAALLALARFARQQRYAFALNGLLFGACVGAGFAAFESAGYALRIGMAAGSASMIDNITMRGLLSPLGHVAWTAISACALWRVRADGVPLLQGLLDRRFLILLGLVMALHFTWNTGWRLPLMLKPLLLGFVAYVVIFSLVQSGLREVRAAARGQPTGLRLVVLDGTTTATGSGST